MLDNPALLFSLHTLAVFGFIYVNLSTRSAIAICICSYGVTYIFTMFVSVKHLPRRAAQQIARLTEWLGVLVQARNFNWNKMFSVRRVTKAQTGGRKKPQERERETVGERESSDSGRQMNQTDWQSVSQVVSQLSVNAAHRRLPHMTINARK